MTYNFIVMPYQSLSLNYLENFNNIFVTVANYPLLIFTNWIDDFDEKRIRESTGWFMVALIFVNIISNIVISSYQVIKETSKSFRNYFIRRQKIKAQKYPQ